MHRLRLWAIGLLCASAVAVAVPAVLAASGWGPLVDAFNGTGLRLFHAFAKAPGNIVISPYSIGTAMAMVLAGARGDNAAEMAKVLGQKLPGDEINAASAAVLASLNGASPASFQLRVANALMLTKPGNAISERYIAVLREKYAAEIFQGADLATVNGWVKEKTNGKIGSILDQLDAMTMLFSSTRSTSRRDGRRRSTPTPRGTRHFTSPTARPRCPRCTCAPTSPWRHGRGTRPFVCPMRADA
jgi:serine protease inhibitor